MTLKLFLNSIIIIFIISLAASVQANPLINANSEDYIMYDIFSASPASQEFNTTITPFSYYKIVPFVENYDRIKLNLNPAEYPEYYIKPLNTITVKYYNSQKDKSFIEGQSGLTLVKGSNLYLFEDALLSLGKNIAAYCQLKQNFNKDDKHFDINRAYAKVLLYKFSIEGGIDNVNLGPGEYGLLLSNNVAPYPMIKMQTEDHLSLFGKWDFMLLHGWLNENREDHSNPRLIAMKFAWKPFNSIELGGTRTILYGGEGTKDIRLPEYHRLISGTKENVPGDKLNSDILTGYDISLYLPIHDYFEFIKITKLYFQEAWSRLGASWQQGPDESDSIKLRERAFQIGFFISTDNSILRMEYAAASGAFYSSSLYNVEGYSYNGLSLGYPYGGNFRSILVKYRYFINDSLSFESKIGGYEQPVFAIRNGVTVNDSTSNYFKSSDIENKSRQYFLSLLIDARIWNVIMEGYIRIEKVSKYDENPMPQQYSITDKNKIFYISGLSASLRL